MSNELKFESPSFSKRIRSMLGVDFYRLFHTPMFYIFILISALISAMVLGMTSMPSPDGTVSEPMYSNTWQIVAADKPLYVVSSIAEYANMNMVFIFGGIMVSIFIGHDYKSGYVKQLFTTHAKKIDYVISKSVVSAFSMACMCVTYLFGGIVAGLFTGMSFSVSISSLIFAIISKIIMSFGWASLYTFINVILRKYFGVSIALSFFFGTGILIIGAAAILGNSSILNVFLYGSSVYACLSADYITVLVCICCSAIWSAIYIKLGAYILSKSDVY